MRLKALAEIYTMHSFAQLCNLNFLSKISLETAKFENLLNTKISNNFEIFRIFLQILAF